MYVCGHCHTRHGAVRVLWVPLGTVCTTGCCAIHLHAPSTAGIPCCCTSANHPHEATGQTGIGATGDAGNGCDCCVCRVFHKCVCLMPTCTIAAGCKHERESGGINAARCGGSAPACSATLTDGGWFWLCKGVIGCIIRTVYHHVVPATSNSVIGGLFSILAIVDASMANT